MMRFIELSFLLISIAVVCRAQTVIGPCIGGACPSNYVCHTATNQCVLSVPITTAAPCFDKAAPGRVSDCPQRRNLCSNPTYKALMADQCPKTCGLCGGGTSSSATCVDLAAPGKLSTCPGQKYLCTDPRYQTLMRQQCPKTCGFC